MARAPLFVANAYRSGANNEAIPLCYRDSAVAAGDGYFAAFAGHRRALGRRRRPQWPISLRQRTCLLNLGP